MGLAEPGQFGFGHGADLMLAYVYFAPGGFFQPGQHVQQGTFAAARLAHDAAEFTLFDGQVHVVERNDPFLAYGVDFAQFFGTDDGCQTPAPFQSGYWPYSTILRQF